MYASETVIFLQQDQFLLWAFFYLKLFLRPKINQNAFNYYEIVC